MVKKVKKTAAAPSLMSPSKMFVYNLSIVLRTIKEKGPLSQADIARKLACSKSAISSSINLLKRLNLVKSAGSGNLKRGRKSILLQFNPEAYFFIAVDLRWKKVNLAIIDMAGNIHHELTYRRTDTDPVLLIKKMSRKILKLIADSSINDDNIEGIGIMVPGIVDTNSGIVRYSSTLGWEEEVPLVKLVRESINKQIIIYNDANALALGEMWIGNGKGYSNMAFIYTEGGLGGACLHNGEIILGDNAAAGEFGKVLITSDNKPQRSEYSLSLPYLLSRYRGKDTADMDYEDIVKEAIGLLQDGNSSGQSSNMMNEIVDKIAQIIVNIIAVFNPQIVIVNCSYLPNPDSFLALVRNKVTEYLPAKPHRTINIVNSKLDDKTEVVGAAAAVINHSRFHFVIHEEVPALFNQQSLLKINSNLYG